MPYKDGKDYVRQTEEEHAEFLSGGCYGIVIGLIVLIILSLIFKE